MTKSRLDEYLEQIKTIENQGYKVELKEDSYLLIQNNIILFDSKYLNGLEAFINAN